MESPLILSTTELASALDKYRSLYYMFRDNMRCTFSQAKSDLLDSLSAFPSRTSTMETLLSELREEKKNSIIEPADIKQQLEESVPPILQAASNRLLQKWIAMTSLAKRTAYYVTAVEVDPYNANLYIIGPSVVLSELLAPSVATCEQQSKVLLTSLTNISDTQADVLEEEDIVHILNDKVPVYTRYIMDAVKFVHESTAKRQINR